MLLTTTATKRVPTFIPSDANAKATVHECSTRLTRKGECNIEESLHWFPCRDARRQLPYGRFTERPSGKMESWYQRLDLCQSVAPTSSSTLRTHESSYITHYIYIYIYIIILWHRIWTFKLVHTLITHIDRTVSVNRPQDEGLGAAPKRQLRSPNAARSRPKDPSPGLSLALSGEPNGRDRDRGWTSGREIDQLQLHALFHHGTRSPNTYDVRMPLQPPVSIPPRPSGAPLGLPAVGQD